MAEYLIQDTTLDAIADAINAKTGGTSAMTPAEMVTEIAAIPSGGGGGSLPSVISKIDGGSFTLASDTLTGSYSISHTLGVVPSGIVMWSDDIVVEAYSVRTVKYLFIIGTYYSITQINTNAADRGVGGTLASGDLGASAFKITVGSNYYKAGATYKWLAWA